MRVRVPKKYHHYLDLFAQAGVYPTKELTLRRIFEHGLNETEFDAWVEGESHLDLGVLEGEYIEIELPQNPEYEDRLQFIAEKYELTISQAATIAFLQGLFGHGLSLQSSELYRTDATFREKVDGMPDGIC